MDWDAPLASTRQSGMTRGGGRGTDRRDRVIAGIGKPKAHRGDAEENRDRQAIQNLTTDLHG